MLSALLNIHCFIMYLETKETVMELTSKQIDGVKFLIGASYDEGGIAATDIIGIANPIFYATGMYTGTIFNQVL